ncbi:MAG TPA: acetate--CoA ligase family protein [Candidatus Nanoarchaeia archaeon]|nr:acetate--CoA ligase family protein [Candidatus Nanoarchaeia archaeon]
MRIFTEKEAERFLKKEGFDIFEEIFIESESGLKSAVRKIGFPLVMKVSGRKIVHKKKIGGVRLGIKSYNQALKFFKELTRIKGAEGVVIESFIKDKRFFLLGLKKTPEFGHVVAFGFGGSDVEEKKDVSFRACPVDKEEIVNMIKETKIGNKLDKKSIDKIRANLIGLCKLAENYPKIKSLDINPLVFERNKAKIIDARIIWE